MKLERHNFSKPSKLAGDLEQRLSAWFTVAGAMAPKKWVKVLPFELGMICGPMDTVLPAQALAQLADAQAVFRVQCSRHAPRDDRPHAEREAHTTLFSFPRQLVLALVAGLLGDASGVLPADRELTGVEEALFDYFFQDFLLAALRESWAGSGRMSLAVEQLERNPQWSRVFADVEKLVACVLVFKGPFGEQACQWLVPIKCILGLLGETDQTAAGDSPGPRLPSPAIKQIVQEVPVDFTVELGTAEVSLVQLARLVEGDMVILNQRVGEPLLASIGGDQKFRGWAGRVGNLQAFQIQSLTGKQGV